MEPLKIDNWVLELFLLRYILLIAENVLFKAIPLYEFVFPYNFIPRGYNEPLLLFFGVTVKTIFVTFTFLLLLSNGILKFIVPSTLSFPFVNLIVWIATALIILFIDTKKVNSALSLLILLEKQYINVNTSVSIDISSNDK